MPETTVIRNADWVIAWDGPRGGHRYLRTADIAFAGNTITHVGARYDGNADKEIEGNGLVVMPGLVNIHSHPMSEPISKGFSEDLGNPRLGMSSLYDYMPVFGPDEAGMAAAAEAAYAELLCGGVTTLVDLSVPYPGWLDLIAESGLRGILAPMFRSARWYTPNGHTVAYEWTEDGGRAAFAAALEVVDQALNHRSGRLSAMVTPAQVDTCTPELLRDSRAAACERGIPLQIHAAQSVVEFQEITRRHGVTPIRWLDGLGLLDDSTIVAHAIFLDHHSWIFWGANEDLTMLAGSGAAVAHCPTVFVRHGMVLEDFHRYRRAGITLGLGTDTFPHNLIEEMRAAITLGRVASRHFETVTTADAFAAATVGGAAALGREDIGRLAPGAKADLVLVDANHAAMRPVRDPLRSLIHAAADRPVRDVYVDGIRVVADGRVLTLDRQAALDRLEAAQRRAEQAVPAKDRLARSARDISPLSLPMDDEDLAP